MQANDEGWAGVPRRRHRGLRERVVAAIERHCGAEDRVLVANVCIGGRADRQSMRSVFLCVDNAAKSTSRAPLWTLNLRIQSVVILELANVTLLVSCRSRRLCDHQSGGNGGEHGERPHYLAPSPKDTHLFKRSQLSCAYIEIFLAKMCIPVVRHDSRIPQSE